MLKIVLTCLVISFLALPVFAQSVDTAWVRRYNGPGNGDDYAYAISVDSSGNIYVTGGSGTIKYDIGGKQLWVGKWGGFAIAADGSDNIYVTGADWSMRPNFDYVTIKYYPEGDTAWVRRYAGPVDSTDYANAKAIDESGNVYVTGYSWSSETLLDYVTIKYDPNGNEVWVAKYNGPGNGWDQAWAISVDTRTNVYVSGRSSSIATSSDYATIKYYPNGDTAWVRRYNGPANWVDAASAILTDDFGNVYVTGSSFGNGASDDYTTIKYDSTGEELWVARYNGPGNFNDVARAIAIDGGGNVYVTGYSSGSGTSDDYATMKYYPNGDTAWVRRYNGPGNASDVAIDIATDDAGNVYVTGYSAQSNIAPYNYDYATIKYDSAGNQLWVKRYNGPGNGWDWACGVTIDTSGNIYVAGYSYGSATSYDYATIKYVQFLRGDANHDKDVNIVDIVYLVSYLFKRGPLPYPILQVGDTNCDGKVNLSDVVYLVAYLFKGGPAPCI